MPLCAETALIIAVNEEIINILLISIFISGQLKNQIIKNPGIYYNEFLKLFVTWDD